MDDRAFLNEFDDLEEGHHYQPPSSLLDKLRTALSDQRVYLTNPSSYAALLGVSEGVVSCPDDGSVYTGKAGLALFLLKIGDFERASEIARDALKVMSRSRPTFLCGFPGPLAILAVAEARSERPPIDLAPILDLADQVTDLSSSLPDELLYGRAGYLYTLLYLRAELGAESVPASTVRCVVDSILASGRDLAKQVGSRSPLMWKWHDKMYFGAAHGMAGILAVLLQAREHLTPAELTEQVRPALDYLLNTAFPSGNFPSSKGNDKDRLVHWCHGAPGLIPALLLGHQVWGGDRYLTAACHGGHLVWRRGLLKKGNGLCHGSAGNGYSLLLLHQVTGEERWLYRAACFAVWCSELARPDMRRPDSPLSLFEGLAGTSYFLHDILSPTQAKFPALLLQPF